MHILNFIIYLINSDQEQTVQTDISVQGPQIE